MNNSFAEALLSEPIELVDGCLISGEPRLLELRIGAPQIVTPEGRALGHSSRQEASTERTVREECNIVGAAIRKNVAFYAALEKMDDTLIEAAADLGCRRWKAFWLVTLPLSAPGVLAGALLCFIPIVGEFVIPDLLGSSQTMMIGQTLWTEFFANKDWPVASAVAVVLLCLLVAPMLFYQQMRARGLEGGR